MSIELPQREQSILQEAEHLINGPRQEDYAHPYDDFTRIAKLWSAILGIEVPAERVPLMMVGVKISRECNKHKRDNLVDGAGYFGTLELLYAKKKQLEETNQLSKDLLL